MTITLRQKVLILVVVAIVAFEFWYFASRRDDNKSHIVASWVAYMPELEMRQRKDESQLLYSSHHWDPAYPRLYIMEDGVSYSLLSKIAYGCEVREYAISHFIGPTPKLRTYQMPDRLFLGALDATQAKCLRTALPEGYVLAKLSAPIRPHAVGWTKGDLQINPDQK